jgi:hypothetical protein
MRGAYRRALASSMLAANASGSCPGIACIAEQGIRFSVARPVFHLLDETHRLERGNTFVEWKKRKRTLTRSIVQERK